MFRYRVSSYLAHHVAKEAAKEKVESNAGKDQQAKGWEDFQKDSEHQ